jgi:hypothetical protein
MPFKLVWEPRSVYVKFDGFVTDVEFMAAAKALQSDERFEDVRVRIYDFLDITGFDLSASTLDLLVAMTFGVFAYCPKGSMALAMTDPNLTQFAKKYCAEQAGCFPAAVFASLQEAWNWAEGASYPVVQVQQRK